MKKLHIINPNSSQPVTDTIRATAVGLLPDLADRMVFATLADAPAGIVNQGHSDRAAVLLADHVRHADAYAGAFLIACFSDPGLYAAREITSSPVIGIGQASLAAAAAFGSRVGVVAISRHAIARHFRHYAAVGLRSLVVGERAIDLAVDQSGNDVARARVIEVATALRDRDGAEVIILGCAGMSALRAEIESSVGLPVVDPVAAGLAVAAERLTNAAHV
ncbi:Asp/Glu racemase [Sphingobium sp. AR-3-1]|uniref:Asp/Glu racemase n=1 Tax=Sphingobium psychrophilum TaxID=2728834 RepID=A0A7X9WXJ1_9SPHN|nr:aspartate/glutamate racemase family protein [Sphingobium psychrophilum]NML11727.1 Asp/Glu racemase [Sphingobium psychrophilum]